MRIIDPSSYDPREAADKLVTLRRLNLGGPSAVPRVVQILDQDGQYLVTMNFLVGLRPDGMEEMFEGVDVGQFRSLVSGGRFRCCVCGADTTDAFDYVEVRLTTDLNENFQVLGAHAACLNDSWDAAARVEIV